MYDVFFVYKFFWHLAVALTQRLELCYRFSMVFTLFDFGIENLTKLRSILRFSAHPAWLSKALVTACSTTSPWDKGRMKWGGHRVGWDQLTFHVISFMMISDTSD